MITVFITKYALTAGIYEAKAELCNEVHGMIAVKSNWGDNYYHGEGREWHRTEEAALARAEELCQKKLASVLKQTVALRKMTFEIKKLEQPTSPSAT